MSNESNERKRRKHYAEKVESEILTLNVELENFNLKLKEISFEQLKRINANRLKELRDEIQRIKYYTNSINKNIEQLSAPDWNGNEILKHGDMEILIPKTY